MVLAPLNKKQRREIYLKLAELFGSIDSKKDYAGSSLTTKFLCHALSKEYTGDDFGLLEDTEVQELFPEFALFKPIGAEIECGIGGGWWPTKTGNNYFFCLEGFQIRASVLTICAEMCK